MDDFSAWFSESIPVRLNSLNDEFKLLSGRSMRTMARQAEINGLLQLENAELRLRLGVLIRLLVQQGAITSEQFSSAVDEAKISLEGDRTQPTVQPVATPPPKVARLPKPPKPLKSVPPKAG